MSGIIIVRKENSENTVVTTFSNSDDFRYKLSDAILRTGGSPVDANLAVPQAVSAWNRQQGSAALIGTVSRIGGPTFCLSVMIPVDSDASIS